MLEPVAVSLTEGTISRDVREALEVHAELDTRRRTDTRDGSGDVAASIRVEHASGQRRPVGVGGLVVLRHGGTVEAREAGGVSSTLVDDGTLEGEDAVERRRQDRENTALGAGQQSGRGSRRLNLSDLGSDQGGIAEDSKSERGQHDGCMLMCCV